MISVIVPVHNAEKTIRRCIEAILNQSLQDFELILVDDGSIDMSPDICREYECDNVSLYCLQHHGVSFARNYGLRHARGSYVAFCDSDDYYGKDYLMMMSDTAHKTGADIVISGYYVMTDDDLYIRCYDTSEFYEKENVIKSIVYDNYIGGYCWNKFFSRKAIQDMLFPEDITHCEDTYFLFGVFEHTDKIFYLNEPLYYYNNRENSTTGNPDNARSSDDRSQYSIAIEKIISDFQPSDIIRNYLGLMEFNLACMEETLYRGSGRTNRNFIKNLKLDVRQNFNYYLKSEHYNILMKMKMLVKILIQRI